MHEQTLSSKLICQKMAMKSIEVKQESMTSIKINILDTQKFTMMCVSRMEVI